MTTEDLGQMTSKDLPLILKETLNEARARQNELDEALAKLLIAIEENKRFRKDLEEAERILEEHMQYN